MRIHPCGPAQLSEIQGIFNEAILHTTALYEYEARDDGFMEEWWQKKQAGCWPVLGAFTPSGALMGFSTYGPFRAFPAYQFTIEHSVYVRPEYRRRGIATELLRSLIAEAQGRAYRKMIGVIDADNQASLALHSQLGYQRAGRLNAVGYKFDRWLDIELVQLDLRHT